MDGDGSIITYKDHYNTFKNPEYVYTRLWLVFVSASETHIKWIRDTICRLILLKGHLWKSKPELSHRVNIWKIKYARKNLLNYFGEFITMKIFLT